MARAFRALRRAEWLLPARLGIGGECVRARPDQCINARRLGRYALDRPDAGRLAMAGLQDSAPGARERASLWHAVHATARSRCHREGCRPTVATGPAGRRPCARAARHVARRRRDEAVRERAAAGWVTVACADVLSARLAGCDARCRRIAAGGAGIQEAEGVAPSTQPPWRTGRGRVHDRAHAG